MGLLSGELADGSEQGGVDGSSIEKESAENFEDASFIGGIEGGRGVGRGGELGFSPIGGTLPRMRCMFGFGKCDVLETLERAFDVAGH